MDANQTFKSIVAAILQLPEDRVVDDLTPDQIDTWDSLNHINLIGSLEQEFGVMLATENLEQTQSIRALKALLRKHGVKL